MYQDYWNGVAQRPAQSTMRRVPQRRPQMAGGMLGGHAYGDDGLLPPRPGVGSQVGGLPISGYPMASGAKLPGMVNFMGSNKVGGPTSGWSGIGRPTGLPVDPGFGYSPASTPLPPGAIRLPDGRVGYRKPANRVPTNANIQQMLTDIASGGGDINSLLQALLFQQVSPQQMGNRGVASGSWGGY